MDVRNKIPIPILTALSKPWFISWQPHGKLIAFQVGNQESSEIWLAQVDGKNRRKLIKSGSGDRFPCWSPDGKSIAFTRGTNRKAHIWIAEISLEP
jgi:Tol biopolymer transport system component